MGRHSAPDDGLDDDPEDALAVATLSDPEVGEIATFRPGRHARADESSASDVADILGATHDTVRFAAVRDESASATTAQIAPVVVEDPASAAEPAVAAEQPPTPAGSGGGSAADLRLVREHGDVRARCIAGVVAPFAAYAVVFAVLGRLNVSALVWIWIPLITAGVLVGVFLDAGHKRYGIDRSAPAPEAH